MVFSFKQFDITQNKSAMKIGTDSVLLGCLCDATNAKRILDIGTGTGLLALMMAQKSEANIDAVEIDDAAFEEASVNCSKSVWSNRITVYHQRIQDFVTSNKYDLILSNPPFYQASSNLSIVDEQRSKARHDKDLPFDELVASVVRLLANEGCFWLVLPSAEAALFKALAGQAGLYLTKQINIQSKASKVPNRLVMCLEKSEKELQTACVVIYEEDGTHTQAYINLTKDYYLWKQFDEDDRLKI